MLQEAAIVSRLGEERRYNLGAVGIRRVDDKIVQAYNGHPKMPESSAHAEVRLSRKLGKNGGTIYVARTIKLGLISGYGWALAKPCYMCEMICRNRGVNLIYYTIASGEYGCVEL